METVSWFLDNWGGISAMFLFLVYFGYNRSMKKSEVKISEANAVEGVSNMYDKFVSAYEKRWDELNRELNDLYTELNQIKDTNRHLKYDVSKFERVAVGLSREIGNLKTVRKELESIACLNFKCQEREPSLGTYTHKQETDE